MKILNHFDLVVGNVFFAWLIQKNDFASVDFAQEHKQRTKSKVTNENIIDWKSNMLRPKTKKENSNTVEC